MKIHRAITGALTRYAADIVGLLALGLVILGVWGLAGWQWAAIAAGLPPAAFYLYGQVQLARGPKVHS